MNENIDLTKILKNCPVGWKFYSYVFGEETYFKGLSPYQGSPLPISIYGKYEGFRFHLSSKGHPHNDSYGECCIFPSKDQRDWSKFTAPWYNLKKQGEDKKEINNFDVLPGLYKCIHRMFDGTPDGRLLFEIGNVYKCLSKHDRAEFEVSYGHSVYLEDPVVCRYFTPFESKDEQTSSQTNIGKNEQKPADKIEPKFKILDWIISSVLGTAHIIGVNDSNEYQLEYIDGKQKFSSIDYVNYEYDKWTINDAKDGDVLALSWLEGKNLFEKIIIFKKYHSEGVKGLYSMPCVEGYGKTFKNGKIAFPDEEVPYYSKTWTCNLYPAIKEQRNLLFQKIKEAGYKWNDETKTLEKLIKPKFKVGDRIRHKETNRDDVYEITKVYDDFYGIAGFTWAIYIKYQDLYELVPNKFDPKTLKPFDKVLVSIDGEWQCDFFSHMLNGGIFNKRCIGVGDMNIVIPYNDDTKHLVGTTEEAPEYYRYWED